MSVKLVQQGVLIRMAELAHAKSMPRMAVIKVSDCGYRGNFAQCRIVGQMLAEGENASPEGRNEIVYFRVADVLSGTMVEEGRTPAR
ncbi:hypothetical protein GCM10022280_22050 [Sphingomonas swuensis]|uniref:Uncharacterized protein n=2 Tax=Sphingomonas swuensis TaxID=977800 RepID=A0ABP7T4T0_9SPHN